MCSYCRVEDLDSEVRSMKTQTILLKMEGKQKQTTIESLTNTVGLMEKDNTKLLEVTTVNLIDIKEL